MVKREWHVKKVGLRSHHNPLPPTPLGTTWKFNHMTGTVSSLVSKPTAPSSGRIPPMNQTRFLLTWNSDKAFFIRGECVILHRIEHCYCISVELEYIFLNHCTCLFHLPDLSFIVCHVIHFLSTSLDSPCSYNILFVPQKWTLIWRLLSLVFCCFSWFWCKKSNPAWPRKETTSNRGQKSWKKVWEKWKKHWIVAVNIHFIIYEK